MYQFKDDINYVNFFRFDKELVGSKKWANLPKASKSVYPVIVVHCNKKGAAFPSQETIAILAGKTEKTVREGLKGLQGFPGFNSYKKLNGRGRPTLRYKIDVTPDERGRSFALYKCLFESGYWSRLSSNAHSLYIVMRTFAFFDGELYCELEGLDEDLDCAYIVEGLIKNGVYQHRTYDFVYTAKGTLAKYAGINSSGGLYSALDKLKENHLIIEIGPFEGYDTWKILRIPPIYFPPSLLNDSVKKRYGTKDAVNSN